MSRHKHSLKRFTINTDFFHDERIIALGALYGAIGPLAAVMLLSIIANRGYYEQWNEPIKLKLYSMVPESDIQTLEAIVGKLVEWGFFDSRLFKERGILTSAEIQKGFFRIKRRATLDDNLPYIIDHVEELTAAPVQTWDKQTTSKIVNNEELQPNSPAKRPTVEATEDADFDYSLFSRADNNRHLTAKTG